MFSIEGNKITLTRGDTLVVEVEILKGKDVYTPQEGETVRFALKRNKVKADRSGFRDEEPLILKDIPTDTMILELEPQDTKALPFDTYVYDIEITLKSGRVCTFIAKSPFKLTEEVH